MAKVLVVEDEYLIAELLASELRELNHHVIGPALNCSAALQAIWAERPDIALVDTELGNETCEIVLDECTKHNIPVIISSAHSSDHLPAYAASLPSVVKPFLRDQLVMALLGTGLITA